MRVKYLTLLCFAQNRTNLLDLRIYFEELSFEEIKQVPAYDSGSLQSKISA